MAAECRHDRLLYSAKSSHSLMNTWQSPMAEIKFSQVKDNLPFQLEMHIIIGKLDGLYVLQIESEISISKLFLRHRKGTCGASNYSQYFCERHIPKAG